MVFQDPTDSLNPRFTAARAIADPIMQLGDIRGRDALRARCEELATMVGLPHNLLDRFPHQLSGGQKARVGIARAIALHPKLVILDEPTAALDVSVQAVVLNLLQDLKARLGMSYLFVSHDLNVVRLLCDRVIVMRTGRIVEEGSSERVLSDPQDDYTKELLTAIPHPPLQVHWMHRELFGSVMAEPLDDYIDAVAKALALPVEEAWRPAVRANLEVSLRLGRLVDEFALPDETEPRRSSRSDAAMTTKPEMTAADIAKAVAGGKMSALDATEAALARIKQHDTVLNSFTDVTADRARAKARAVDAEIAAGKTVGPLAGVPFAVKNLFDVAGLPTRAGSKINRDLAPATRDATLIERHGSGRRGAGRRAQHGRIRL